MGAMSRTKGKQGENEVAAVLREWLGVEVKRNLVQTRDGGADLLGIDHWAIEVKRAKRLEYAPWWEQAKSQAVIACKKPVLVYRLDRYGVGLPDEWKWQAVVRSDDVGLPSGFEVTMPLRGWIDIVREEMSA